MSSAPLLPVLPGGLLPPVAVLMRWLEDLRADGVDTVIAGGLPPVNGSLPDALRLGGIATLLAGGLPRPAFRWEGLGGARVTSAEAPPTAATRLAEFHHGDLPGFGQHAPEDEVLLDLVDLARLQDASACLGVGDGASWHQVLTAFDRSRTPRLPPLMPRALSSGSLGVWNPVPFARHVVAELPATSKPWGLRDGAGRSYPVQVVDHDGQQRLLVPLFLQALEATTLAPIDDPVADAQWEVSTTVLDNGIVRAEFDPLGQVVRLCWNGVFAELAGPAVAPMLDQRLLGGTATATVKEAGPVRAVLLIERRMNEGLLTLRYVLHANDDGLRVDARFTPAPGTNAPLVLDHPTAHRSCRLHLAGELAASSYAQAHSLVTPAMEPLAGVRWAALGDAGGRGLALVSGRGLTCSARGGALRVHTQQRDEQTRAASYALHAAQRHGDARRPGGLSLGHLAQHHAHAGRGIDLEAPIAAPFRIADGGTLVPLWIRRPAGWAGELALIDQGGCRGRSYLFPRERPTEAWRVDAHGQGMSAIELTRDGDGLHLDHAANELLLMRWK